MPSIFLSHSSQDDRLAAALEAWLRGNGFDDLFVDHADIRSGDKWTEALRRAKGSCRVVLCLVTPAWLSSDECFGEFTAGWYAGRRIIPLLALGGAALDEKQQLRLRRLLSEDQGADLSKAGAPAALDLDSDPGVAEPLKAGLRAAGALARVGLDPYAFEIDRTVRPEPFPGLQSFGDTDADAAVFFGRSDAIARCLEDLREMRATGDRRVYALLGASGSGKSSLLKAGLLPRLRRERAWLALRVFRPGIDPLYNFAEAIALTAAQLDLERSPGALRDALRDAWRGKADLRKTLDEIMAPLKLRAHRADATVLIAVDQGEELARAEGESADALAAYLKAALAEATEGEPTPYAVVVTVRTDTMPELEASRRIEGLVARSQNVRTLPVYSFDTAIEQPAARYGVEIEPALVEALMEEIGTEDALPILAFSLQRLWRQYEKERRIRKANYDSIGKLSGLIEDAAERALRGIDPLAPQAPIEGKLSDARDKQGAQVFLPSLAQVNEGGAVIRRVARLSAFDEAGKQLLGAFDKWRLVVTRGEGVEVAHEAMFREWPRFQAWLAPEKARLEALRGVETAAASWDAKQRKPDDLTHRGRRLAEAAALDKVPDYKAQLDRSPLARAYLEACRRAQRRRRTIAAAAALAAVCSPLAAIYAADALEHMARERAAARAAAYVPTAPVLATGQRAGTLPPGSSFRDCAHCPEMVVIPGDAFMMGSSDEEEFREKDEGPQHRVAIATFAVGKFDATFDDWEACVADGGCRSNSRPDDRGWGRGRHPVISVSWTDAEEYVHWLAARTGKPYRLLTEAEWEYAARARTATPYWTGASIDSSQAEFNTGPQRTYPVGSYAPNPFGLYDMVGNVWQWLEDCYLPDYGSTPTDGSAAVASGCLEHVLRGGSWIDLPRYLRSALRFKLLYTVTGDSIGFRVARGLSPATAASAAPAEGGR
ncbi:MAG TPA: SUMF1/EgtB/PvdO family nonheme iron enzyme [Stellaceae bacterium]|nr:SUMF1/EgtB/PvdO family nonheme iron enzyme [Stellaceae bacterium]